jgi:hypothetical protein
MNRTEAINAIDEAFADVPRPTMFIRGTCLCEECMEHNETMLRLKRKELSLEALDNPGWDPICFASDAAFQYLMPGLARLVLEHTDQYIQQFLFHIEQPDRLACLTSAQACAVRGVLDVLALEESAAVDNNLAADSLIRARKQLEQSAGANGLPPVAQQ